MLGWGATKERVHTVDSNSYALCQLIAICSHECWNSSKLVDLDVFGAQRPFPRVCVNDFEVELIRLGHSFDSYGTRVALWPLC